MEKDLERICKHYPFDDNNNEIICIVPKEIKGWSKDRCYKPEQCPYLKYYKETKQTLIMYVNG